MCERLWWQHLLQAEVRLRAGGATPPPLLDCGALGAMRDAWLAQQHTSFYQVPNRLAPWPTLAQPSPNPWQTPGQPSADPQPTDRLPTSADTQRLQPCATKAATPHSPGCSPAHPPCMRFATR